MLEKLKCMNKNKKMMQKRGAGSKQVVQKIKMHIGPK
jgi:hypothetical protein